MLENIKLDKYLSILKSIPFQKPFFKQKISIGLDIGSSNIKLIVLEKKQNEMILKKFCHAAIPQGADAATLLDSFVKSEGLAGSCVNVSLAGPAVVMRYISFPPMTLQQLKSTMQFEAKEYIPFPLEEVILDCSILKEKMQDGKMLVLLVAVKKSVIQERLGLLEKAGLTPRIIDVDCLCLVNAFNYSYRPSAKQPQEKGEIISLLNIGAQFTNMVIIQDGILEFSRDIAVGGSDITKKISETKGVDYNQAELIQADPQKSEEVISIIEPIINNLSYEIRLSIDYYENQNGLTMDRIFISGGLSNSARISKILSDSLGIAVSSFDFISAIKADAFLNPEELKKKQNSFAIALGLALR